MRAVEKTFYSTMSPGESSEWIERPDYGASRMHLDSDKTVLVTKSDFTGLTPENIGGLLSAAEAEQQRQMKRFKAARKKLLDSEAELIALRAYESFLQAEKHLAEFSTHNEKVQVRKGRCRTWQMSNRIYRWREDAFTRAGGGVTATCQLLVSHPFFFRWIYWADDVVLIEYKERFGDMTEASAWFEKQLEGFRHLFKEESPPVPKVLERLFSLQGNILPGIRFDDGIIDRRLIEPKLRHLGLLW